MSSSAGVINNYSVIKAFQSLKLDSPAKIVSMAHKGISPSLFYSLTRAIKMPEKALAALLHTHPRTISNYQEGQKKLDAPQSEHLLKLIALFIKGEQIFGTVDEFNYWLQKPFWNKAEKPIEWLITPGGVDLVSDELDRLAHGYAV
jgi:putative toxin-antitoxin system antitoxin component (TIGR02293 family)